MAWPTAKEIVNDAGILVGLFDADLDDPLASEDQAIRQLCRLLKVSGREIVREREWSHLTREATITTADGVRAYPLPEDFRAMLQQTGWDRTGTRPLGGPLSPQEWQAAKGKDETYGGRVMFRPANREIWLLEDELPADLEVVYEYRTNWWAGEPADLAPSKEYPTASLDMVFIDVHVATLRLILEWKKTKGLDTTSAQQDYDDAYRKAAAADAPKRTLSLGGPHEGERLIGPDNAPLSVPWP